jgi:hypothetical protein
VPSTTTPGTTTPSTTTPGATTTGAGTTHSGATGVVTPPAAGSPQTSVSASPATISKLEKRLAETKSPTVRKYLSKLIEAAKRGK